MITLLDGGLGQEIYKRSKQPARPLWSIAVMQASPETVQSVHRDFIEAGARVITLNTYTATPSRLRRDGDPKQLQDIHAQAIQLAQAARDEAGQAVQIAGCLPPLVGSYDALHTPSYEDCLAEYRQMVEAQDEGVDLFLIETISTLREGMAAVEAARESGKPVLLSFTVSDDAPQVIRSGQSLLEVVAKVAELPLSALLVNCATPEAIGRAIDLLATGPFPYGGYANGFVSVEALKPGGTVDVLRARQDLPPEAYAKDVMAWVGKGASIVGGCCETGPAHIAALRQQLEAAGYRVGGLSL
jgi:homocysteine S-methyltransferase